MNGNEISLFFIELDWLIGVVLASMYNARLSKAVVSQKYMDLK